MQDLNADVETAMRDIASRNDIGLDAVEVLFRALVAGRGVQAQFNHPGLGGMGQWSKGGMIMIGDMFNTDLKDRISRACTALSELVHAMPPASSQSEVPGQGASMSGSDKSRHWWPEELGHAASTGAQNSLRYAFFPASHRLAIDTDGQIAVYDTKDHRITGFSQQQSGDQSITFTSQHGPVRIAELEPVEVSGHKPDGDAVGSSPETTDTSHSHAPKPSPQEKPAGQATEHDIFGKIERLAGLHGKGMLSDAEYQAKKTELLARL